MPTLLIGDFIFVNKYTYGLRLPVINAKILDIGEPERGDVVVFRLPSDSSTNYIKRLIGLPGDTVRYVNRRLYINGEQVGREALGRSIPETVSPGRCCTMRLGRRGTQNPVDAGSAQSRRDIRRARGALFYDGG